MICFLYFFRRSMTLKSRFISKFEMISKFSNKPLDRTRSIGYWLINRIHYFQRGNLHWFNAYSYLWPKDQIVLWSSNGAVWSYMVTDQRQRFSMPAHKWTLNWSQPCTASVPCAGYPIKEIAQYSTDADTTIVLPHWQITFSTGPKFVCLQKDRGLFNSLLPWITYCMHGM